MPCLSGRVSPAGPLINIALGPPGTIAKLQANPVQAGAQSATAPNPGFLTYSALIDTGATRTSVSPAIAQALNLPSRGKTAVASATHVVPMNVYVVDLVLPFGAAGFCLSDMPVIEFACPPNNPFQMLLGRDIICLGVFTMSHDGHYTLSI